MACASSFSRGAVMPDQCKTCGSSAPHMHPAAQHEGEVHICPDAFHTTVTNQNVPTDASILKGRVVEIRKRVKNARGAIESDQVVDKDVHGSLTKILTMLDDLALLMPSDATTAHLVDRSTVLYQADRSPAATKLAFAIRTGAVDNFDAAYLIEQFATLSAALTPAQPGDVREALKAVRQEIVLAIAFLGRDSCPERLQGTVDSLIKRLVDA